MFRHIATFSINFYINMFRTVLKETLIRSRCTKVFILAHRVDLVLTLLAAMD